MSIFRRILGLFRRRSKPAPRRPGFLELSFRDALKELPAARLTLINYDLSKPAKMLYPVGPGGVPFEGWLAYWRYRERAADRQLRFAARTLAAAVIDALQEGSPA